MNEFYKIIKEISTIKCVKIIFYKIKIMSKINSHLLINGYLQTCFLCCIICLRGVKMIFLLRVHRGAAYLVNFYMIV